MIGNLVVTILALVIFSGCSNFKTRRDIKERSDLSAQDSGVTEAQGRSGEGKVDSGGFQVDSKAVEQRERPKQVYVQPPKVGVILGAGGAKALAHSGVLKSLLAEKIPIDYVVGIEWGALIGGLYAQEAKIHDVQWKLYKLKSKDIVGRGMFSSKIEPASVKQLHPFLDSGFSGKRIRSGRVPFSCPSLSLKSGKISWQQGGSFKESISKCIPLPPLFKPYNNWAAGSFVLQETIDYLKQKGIELIIYVDVLGKDRFAKKVNKGDFGTQIFWQEMKRYLQNQRVSKFRPNQGLVELIEVNTSKYTISDFESRKSLMTLGSRAGTRRGRMIAEKYGF